MTLEREAGKRAVAKGREHLERGRLELAVAQFEKAVRRDSGDAEPYFQLARAQAQLGRVGDAVTNVKKAIDLEPGNPGLHNVYGELCGMLGNIEDALSGFERALSLDPDCVEAHTNLGVAAASVGDYDSAVTRFDDALRIDPGFGPALHHLAGVCNLRGDLEGAKKHLRKILEREPDNVPVWNNLGATYLNLGEPEAAEKCLRRAVAIRPDYASGHRNLATALHAQNRLHEALDAAEEAIRLAPDSADAHADHGAVLKAMLDFPGAEQSYRRALELDKENGVALSGLAELLDGAGRHEEAQRIVTKAVTAEQITPNVACVYARVKRRMGDPSAAIPVVKSLLDGETKVPIPRHGYVQLNFALGQLYDSMNDPDKAFPCFETANKAKYAPFSPRENRAFFDAVRTCFDKEKLANLPRSESMTERPVFIVGLPRSGKSIIEQILACHPSVYGAGELDTIGRIAESIANETGGSVGYPESVSGLTVEILNRFARRYLERTHQPDSRVTRVVDTLPVNLVHLGLIELLFPNARVIHCRRDVRDTALACFFKDFIDPNLGYTYSLEHLGHYARDCLELMSHWERVSGLRIHEVSYENVIRDTEASARELIDFLGLEWDPVCLRFYEEGVATIADYRCIREPLNDGEVAGYKRYSRYLGVFNAALEGERG